MADSKRLKDLGWVWDGQPVNGQEKLSMFGTGMGTRWFGLSRCCHMFHDNSALAMDLLRDMDDVVCEISKWQSELVTDHPTLTGLGSPIRALHDGRIERKVAEADKVGKLATQYPNIRAIYDDDLMGKIKSEHIGPEQYAAVRDAARSHRPDLDLWAVVYTHELEEQAWSGFEPLMDVVNLWVWKSEDLFGLKDDVARCRERFPGKPIIMGCYLRDYTLLEGVPMDRLKAQWETALELIDNGWLSGYAILGGFLIDTHEEQARWVRDFIAAN